MLYGIVIANNCEIHKMNNYSMQKTKWEKRLKAGIAGHCYDHELLAAGKFCMHVTDIGGGDCGSSVEATGYFDSALDCLGYLRFAELSRILDMAVGPNQEDYMVADAYILRCRPNLDKQVDLLLGLLDRALLSGIVSTPELGRIRYEFNTAFAETDPSVQIECWGNVTETINSSYFNEIDEGEEIPSKLKKLLDNGKFDENNERHLDMAKCFLQSRFRA